MKRLRKCKICRKLTKNKKCCSLKCTHKYCKKHKLGFWSFEVQSKGGNKGGKIAAEVNRKNGTAFFDPKIQSMGGKIGGKKGGLKTVRSHRNNKTGMWSRKNILKRIKIQRKRKTGFWSLEIQKKGGLKSVESNRLNKPYKWKGVNFMSKQEMEAAKIILNKPIVGVNCHIKINDRSVIDFYPNWKDKLFNGKFVEYHPWDRTRTPKQYYKERRKILDNNGYKNKELMILDSKFLDEKFVKE